MLGSSRPASLLHAAQDYVSAGVALRDVALVADQVGRIGAPAVLNALLLFAGQRPLRPSVPAKARATRFDGIAIGGPGAFALLGDEGRAGGGRAHRTPAAFRIDVHPGHGDYPQQDANAGEHDDGAERASLAWGRTSDAGPDRF